MMSVTTQTLPMIAVTPGDPAGIGPEICARLFAEFEPRHSRPVLIGEPSVFEPWRERFGLNTVPVPAAAALRDVAGKSGGGVLMLHTGVQDRFPIGENSRGGGRHAGRAIELACELVRNGSVRAIVTAPVSKKSLNLADFEYPGHTEMLAQYLNAPSCQMMMVHNNLRVVPLTRHLPLRDVADRITGEAVKTCIRETARALEEDFGIVAPRIAVAALNPHAGESGMLGTEERDVIAPAIAELSGLGHEVTGPFPADALFQKVFEGISQGRRMYDAVITMYHDQGLVPFKMLAQRTGVNVTVGLPVIRTSVDHGSAFDIAGQGKAETDSLLEAYKLAERAARRAQ